MKTKLIVSLLAAVAALPLAAQRGQQAQPADVAATAWLDPAVNRVYTLAPHTPFFGFESEQLAARGDKSASARYLSLEGQWDFRFYQNYDEAPADFYAPGFRTDGWTKFPVPGLFEMNGYGAPIYKNIGYAWATQFDNDPPRVETRNNYTGLYRRTVTLPADWERQHVTLHVGSATSNLAVWVNGRFIGYSEDSKVAAEFDLTPYVRAGQENLIVMRVMRWCDGSYLEDQDFWRFTGIAREVYLAARPEQHINDIRITSQLVNDYRDGQLTVSLDAPAAKGCTVDYTLLDKDGSVVYQDKGNAPRKKINVTLPGIRPWTAETPNLYNLRVTLRCGGQVAESFQQRVGFRTVEIKDAQLLVNGRPVLIKGVNRHEMDPDGGYVVSTERMVQDLREMKRMGVNAVRTCHYPDDPRFYDLLDEWGFYVVAEANIESHGMGYGDKTLARVPEWRQAHLERNRNNVETFKNHPSIIIWSLGNEAGYGPNFEDAYDMVKAYDPTRPVQYERAGLEGKTDIFCPMYYNYAACERYLSNNPPKPLIQCEYAHAMGNSEGGFREYWELIRKYPNYQGGFIWDFVDQGIYAHRDSSGVMQVGRGATENGIPSFAYGGDFGRYPASDHNFNCNGLLRPDRVWNPHAYEVQYWHQPLWTALKDSATCTLEVFNENFFAPVEGATVQWQYGDGMSSINGECPLPTIAPQGRVTIVLPEVAARMAREKEKASNILTLNYVTGKATSETFGCDTLARQQFTFNAEAYSKMIGTLIEHAVSEAPAVEKDETNSAVIYKAENYSVTFNKQTGWIDYLDCDGKAMLQPGTSIVPNFWRAPTDNDYGAGLQRRFAAWKSPELKLTSLEFGEKGAKAVYDMPNLHCTLRMEYTLLANKLAVTEELIPSSKAKDYELPRFALQLTMPRQYDNVAYIGRGPVENYIDRHDAAFIGNYEEKVADQYYGYVRPQESGNHIDTRLLSLIASADKHIPYLYVLGAEPFEFSALNYEVSDLDGGPVKEAHHMHSGDLRPRPYTVVNIGKQMGLGCVDSWGSTPRPEYMLKARDCRQTFLLVFGK
ncbi:MAG: beta-galactosidase [Bacteroidaceae bacterium]|nr:beta-galactosidase [Bacteroidaceae bacterium]